MLKRIPAALWFALLFILAGLPFIRLPGLHVDASSELACFYPCSQPVFRPTFLDNPVPVMVLSYLGAFKAWLYLPILQFLELSSTVLRLPLLLVGAASIWFFFAILERTAGRRAAIAGALLLVTDVSFVIDTALDFGPVALLHCMLLAGIWLLLRFDERGSNRYLAAAFFLFGLAMWHKALFIWMMGGMAAAAIAVFPGRLRVHLTGKRLALAAAAFCIGAAPLLWYNAATGGDTFRTGHVMTEIVSVPQKLLVLRKTLDGSAFIDFLLEETAPAQNLRTPSHVATRAAAAVDRLMGSMRINFMFFGLLLSLLLLPWLWFTPARRPAYFAAVYMAVAYCLIIALPKTGGSIHHAILIWPFPHYLMAVAGAQVATRFGRRGAIAMIAVLALLVGCNVALLNRYTVRLATLGPRAIFTDAVWPLYTYLSTFENPTVLAVDWGYGDTLCLLSDGEFDVRNIVYPLAAGPDDATVRSWLNAPHAVFVGRVAADEIFRGVHHRMDAAAAALGYTKLPLTLIQDRNRRPRFEIYVYEKR
jgi:hypothetical protein